MIHQLVVQGRDEDEACYFGISIDFEKWTDRQSEYEISDIVGDFSERKLKAKQNTGLLRNAENPKTSHSNMAILYGALEVLVTSVFLKHHFQFLLLKSISG